jgi:hypothetical protein
MMTDLACLGLYNKGNLDTEVSWQKQVSCFEYFAMVNVRNIYFLGLASVLVTGKQLWLTLRLRNVQETSNMQYATS